MKKDNIIKLNPNFNINLGDNNKHNSILVIGNFYGFFGEPDEEGFLPNLSKCSKEIVDMITWLFIKNKDTKHVFVGTYDKVGKYLSNLRKTVTNLFGINIKEENWIEYLVKEDSDQLDILNKVSEEMPKFDYIIQNPPYNGSLHIKFFNKGLDILSDSGKMVIIEPATWLINIRSFEQRSKANTLYTPLKNRITNKVESIHIDNMNNYFKTSDHKPYAITVINNKLNDKNFIFNCCGYKEVVNDINECNLLLSSKCINIIKKINSFKLDNINDHVTQVDTGKNFYYIKYANIIGSMLCASLDPKRNDNIPNIINDTVINKVKSAFCTNNDIVLMTYDAYYSPLYHKTKNSIKNSIHHTLDKGGNETNKSAECVYGTYEEMVNYKHYVLNNTLPLFINICMTIDQNNNSLKYVPWLVDKQYTDQEIYDMFGFTQKEINLIEKTIKRYSINSPWFRRYILGMEYYSDQEVQEFCDRLDKEYPTD